MSRIEGYLVGFLLGLSSNVSRYEVEISSMGVALPVGIYFMKLDSVGFTAVSKLIILR